MPTVQSCGVKKRFASSAWLRVLVLALLCLLLSPVRSCLLQADGVWRGRCRRSGGGQPLRSSLRTLIVLRYRPPKTRTAPPRNKFIFYHRFTSDLSLPPPKTIIRGDILLCTVYFIYGIRNLFYVCNKRNKHSSELFVQYAANTSQQVAL